MPSTLLLRRKIRSVKNMRQITRAMELVASAKMKKSQDMLHAARPFAAESWGLLDRLLKQFHLEHPFLGERPIVRNVTIVMFSSDRGLCGSFNVNVARRALETARVVGSEYQFATIEWVCVGKKAREVVRKTGGRIIADFPKPDRVVHVSDIASVRHLVVERFLKQETDRVILVYTDFVSGLVQKARLHQLLPWPQLNSFEELARQSGLGQTTRNIDISTYRNVEQEYVFEPSAVAIADMLLPAMIDTVLYQALVESNASEHAARRMAMKNATDAAADMIDDFTLIFNQTRQAKITQEIAEIATAAAVMTT